MKLAADKLSRSPDSTDWLLSDRAFNRLEQQCVPYTPDRFATSLKRKCGRYYSATEDPGLAGVNAMAHSWMDENCWASLAFQLIGPLVCRILRSGAQAELNTPVWKAHPWCARAVSGCSAWLELPPDKGVFTHGTGATPASAPTWRVAAFRFAGPSATESPL